MVLKSLGAADDGAISEVVIILNSLGTADDSAFKIFSKFCLLTELLTFGF